MIPSWLHIYPSLCSRLSLWFVSVWSSLPATEGYILFISYTTVMDMKTWDFLTAKLKLIIILYPSYEWASIIYLSYVHHWFCICGMLEECAAVWQPVNICCPAIPSAWYRNPEIPHHIPCARKLFSCARAMTSSGHVVCLSLCPRDFWQIRSVLSTHSSGIFFKRIGLSFLRTKIRNCNDPLMCPKTNHESVIIWVYSYHGPNQPQTSLWAIPRWPLKLTLP